MTQAHWHTLYPVVLVLLWILILWCAGYIIIQACFAIQKKRDTDWVFLGALLSAAAALLYFKPPAYGLAVSDAIEYAIAAKRAVLEGTYSIVVGGQVYPPRYPPFFSVLILAPAYYLFGMVLLSQALYPVIFFSALAALCVFLLGAWTSSIWGGVTAVLILFLLPEYRYFGGQVMTDVPSLTVYVLGAMLCVAVTVKGRPLNLKDYLAGGILLATAYMLRPVNAVLALPLMLFLLTQSRRIVRHSLALLGPLIILALANLLYNRITFGELWRSGYNFWSAVPYDYYWLTFAPRYFGSNLQHLLKSAVAPLFMIAAALLILVKRQKTTARSPELPTLAAFTWLVGVPLLAIYLFYFYFATRFYLPLMGLLAVICGALVGKLLTRWLKAGLLAIIPLLILTAGAASHKFAGTLGNPALETRAGDLRAATPNSALIISTMNPAYFEEAVSAGSQRKLLPWSREIEYASKVVTLRKIVPPPGVKLDSPLEHRADWLLKFGAVDPFPLVAKDEKPEALQRAAQGKPVYFDSNEIPASDLDNFISNFAAEPVASASGLYRLHEIKRETSPVSPTPAPSENADGQK